MKEKFRADREKNKAKYGIESDDEEEEEEVEEEESIEEVDDSFDDENREFVEKIPYEQDYAAQKAADESSSGTDEEEEEETYSQKPTLVRECLYKELILFIEIPTDPTDDFD